MSFEIVGYEIPLPKPLNNNEAEICGVCQKGLTRSINLVVKNKKGTELKIHEKCLPL